MYEYQVAMPIRKSRDLDGFGAGLSVVVVVGVFTVVVVVAGGAVVVVVSPGYVVVVVEVVVVEVVVVVGDGPVTSSTTVECQSTWVPGAGDCRVTVVHVPLFASRPWAA
jgi:hypothetical protein